MSVTILDANLLSLCVYYILDYPNPDISISFYLNYFNSLETICSNGLKKRQAEERYCQRIVYWWGLGVGRCYECLTSVTH